MAFTSTMSFVDRFWMKVSFPVLPQGEFLPDDCWVWNGTRNTAGYAVIQETAPSRRVAYSHRVSWELANRCPVPDGMQVDHLCMNKSCVNPDHLEPVTAQENTHRAQRAYGRGVGVTHCPYGHPYSGDNLRFDARTNRRACHICSNEKAKRYQARKRSRVEVKE